MPYSHVKKYLSKADRILALFKFFKNLFYHLKAKLFINPSDLKCRH